MTRSEIDTFFQTLTPDTIYGLCDQALIDSLDITLDAFAAICRHHDVALIQYRNKTGTEAEVAEQLQRLRILWDGVLIVNDRWSLHHLCDGVHLGQEDLQVLGGTALSAASALRERLGDACIIGLSTHNEKEITEANALPIDYIGLGAYRSSGTKEDAAVLGEALDRLASASRHPVAAIGGITFEDRFEHARMRVMGSALAKKGSEWK